MPVSRVIDSPEFETADAAAEAALAIAMEKKHNVEWGGFVLQLKDGRYAYTEAVTCGQRETCAYEGQLLPGARLAAIYHTHPEHEADEYFSEADIATAIRHAVKSYIGVVAGRHMRVFDPESMHAHPQFHLERYGDISPGLLLSTAPSPQAVATLVPRPEPDAEMLKASVHKN
jgi:proteasome lid subunit RPN8/RPN11